jgi:hypothetical protein
MRRYKPARTRPASAGTHPGILAGGSKKEQDPLA